MGRPAKLRSGAQAFLLVEATLTAAIIAVGLVLIGRSLSNSLNALGRIQQRERLLLLAESAFSELESEAQQFQTLQHYEGTFAPPNEGYRWQIAIEPARLGLEDLPDEALRSITLTVSPVDAEIPAVRLSTIWPSDWIVE